MGKPEGSEAGEASPSVPGRGGWQVARNTPDANPPRRPDVGNVGDAGTAMRYLAVGLRKMKK